MSGTTFLYEVAGTRTPQISLFTLLVDGELQLRVARKWVGERPPLPVWEDSINLGSDVDYALSLLEELVSQTRKRVKKEENNHD